MILIALIIAPVIYSLIYLVLAVPGGLFLMLLLSKLHDEVSGFVPTMSYGTAYTVALLLSLTAAWIFPRPISSSTDN